MIEFLGHLGQFATPLMACLHTIEHKDSKGLALFALTIVVNQVVIELLKTIIPRIRPNGHARSFPSGHTAAAFIGASFIASRYGWNEASPAFIIALFVGISRVHCQAHWISDVCAGASIGLILCMPIRRWIIINNENEEILNN